MESNKNQSLGQGSNRIMEEEEIDSKTKEFPPIVQLSDNNSLEEVMMQIDAINILFNKFDENQKIGEEEVERRKEELKQASSDFSDCYTSLLAKSPFNNSEYLTEILGRLQKSMEKVTTSVRDMCASDMEAVEVKCPGVQSREGLGKLRERVQSRYEEIQAKFHTQLMEQALEDLRKLSITPPPIYETPQPLSSSSYSSSPPTNEEEEEEDEVSMKRKRKKKRTKYGRNKPKSTNSSSSMRTTPQSSSSSSSSSFNRDVGGRGRSQHSKEQRQVLEDWYKSNYHNPYPTIEERAILADSANMTSKQVNYWFINKRNRKCSFFEIFFYPCMFDSLFFFFCREA